jgi:hypothetical protein
MAKAVKLDADAKSRLEELQAEIRLRTGESVTQQELLTRIIDDAYATRDELIDSFREEGNTLSEEEVAAFFEAAFDSGIEIDEADIDDILYG